MLGVLKATLHDEIGWTEIGYSNIVFWFQCAYFVALAAVHFLSPRLTRADQRQLER